MLYDSITYSSDLFWRLYSFLYALKMRGDNQVEFEKNGRSTVSIFPTELIMEGKDLGVNYDLHRVIGNIQKGKRPYLFNDPHAGRGAGIYGSKEISQVGISLELGHPTYVTTFNTYPIEGQTLPKVMSAMNYFYKLIAENHNQEISPVIFGNCQAGWLSAITAAHYYNDVKGPIVLSGSPLSFWAGDSALKHKGFLIPGGSIWASFIADLLGYFDGANLSLNFEDTDGRVVIGEKFLNLFHNPDAMSVQKFIENEKWWNNFFHFSTEEIEWILENLFVGNKLENKEIFIDNQVLDMSNMHDAIVIFCSNGDTISPPAQSLGWIPKVYGSDAEIISRGKKIVYMIHPTCGHLGIFASEKIADRYHRGMMNDNMHKIDSLPFGLFEMKVSDSGDVEFFQKSICDIEKISQINETEIQTIKNSINVSTPFITYYKNFMRPFVKSYKNGLASKFLKEMHPMRSSRKVFSSLNPFVQGIDFRKTDYIREESMESENIFFSVENFIMDSIRSYWKLQESIRDRIYKLLMVSS